MNYSRILAAIAAQPWAMQYEKLCAMLDLIKLRAQGSFRSDEEIQAAINPQRANAIAKREGGVAIVPMFGVLSQRMNMLSEFSGGASTERLLSALKSALADNTVKAVVVHVDSPGGGVYGVSEVADFIRNNRQANGGDKPIIAQIDSLSASGGYWITSAADDVAITPGGEAGSIGVYMLHEDVSKWLEDMGVKETFIFSGEHKVEGNPFEPLTDDARGYFQSRVDDYYDMFVDAVAKGRDTATKNVIDNFGKGRVFGAKQALAAGMVDRIATLDETLARYGVSRNNSGRSRASLDKKIALAQKI